MNPLQHRIITVPFVCSLALGMAASQLLIQPLQADELMNISDFKECRAIASEEERLLCYDTIADGGIFNEERLQQVARENFGNKEGPSDIAVEQLAVTIVRVTKSATGTHYFYTDEGAVWKQSNGGRWSRKAPFQAEIKAGVLGSFFLAAESGKLVRVKRVR